MKMRKAKHFNAQQVFRSSIRLDGGVFVVFSNWYSRKRCYSNLLSLHKRMGLYPFTKRKES